jgi:hypothetical protein
VRAHRAICRAACVGASAPSGLGRLTAAPRETRAAAAALARGEPAVVLAVLARPGGLGSGLAEVPSFRESLASMFVPPALLGRRRALPARRDVPSPVKFFTR